ncbi:MAG: DUF2341 domain-containing protein [Gemmatimonadetes bacterium]|nr:DUF2341 domain-containing protein [Gemmatimonadota bacterium]
MIPLRAGLLISLAGAILLVGPGITPEMETAARAETGMAQKVDPTWFDRDWAYRMPFTVNPAQIAGGETFTDFPILVWLDATTHADVFAKAKTDGSDLLFVAKGGEVALSHEIVTYDAGMGEAEIWVRTTTLSSQNNEFELYYGNATATAGPGTDAWSPEYRAVYHFEEDPAGGQLTDSGPQAAHADLQPAAMWTSGDVNDGVVGQGWQFNGTTHHIATKNIGTQDESYTISAWLALTSRSTDFFLHADPGFWKISSQSSDVSPRPDYSQGGGTVIWPPNPVDVNDGFHHFAWMLDAVADTVIFLYDGVPQEPLSTFPAGLSPFYDGLAINPDGTNTIGILGPIFAQVTADYTHGGADEFRLREGRIVPEWVTTEVNNQSDPQTFLTFGPEQVPVPVERTSMGRMRARF